jgi:hypothetical protein
MSGVFVLVALPGSGTTQVNLVTAVERVYTITSTIITDAADISLLSQASRELAEADIRATLDTFEVEMGPTHTDHNGVIRVQATTLDVNAGDYDTMNFSFRHDIRIRTGPFRANIPLNITVARSADDYDSEMLSVRITVLRDGDGLQIGTITGATP